MSASDSIEVNAADVVALVEAHGFAAHLWQSGGWIAVIRAGDSFTDSIGDERFPVLAGPGRFSTGDGPSTFDLGECYVGPDDDGLSETNQASVSGARTARDLADLIVLQLRQGSPWRPLDADTLEAHGFDGTARGIARRIS